MGEEPRRQSASQSVDPSIPVGGEQFYEFGPFRLYPSERKLLRDNQIVPLTPKAFDTLLMLVRNSGHLLEKDEILRTLWPDTFVEEGSLSNYIFLLRKALGEDTQFIETVPRRGYRFVGAVRSIPQMAQLRVMSADYRSPESDSALHLQQPSLRREIGDVRIEIESGQQASAGATASVPTHKNWPRTLAWTAAGVVASAIIGMAAWMLKPAPPAKFVSRTVIDLPPGDQLAQPDYPAIAISPDGAQLAYVAIHGGTQQIYLRALSSLEAKPLAGTEGANTPFFSPDGQWLGFVASGNLKKISVSGGPVVTLGSAPAPRGVTWGSDGTIIFAPTNASGLEQVSEAGGAPRALTHFDKGEGAHGWPDVLPSNEGVLFAAGGADFSWQSNARIVVQSVGSGARRDLVPGGTAPRYAMSGHLIYAKDGSLMAVPFDPQRLQIRGAAVPVLQGVFQAGLAGGAQYALSGSGSLVYIPDTALEAPERLVWVSRNGTEQYLDAPARRYVTPRISPDGRRIAVAIADGDSQIWLYDLDKETLTKFTFEGWNTRPVWTRDGKRLVFRSGVKNPNIVWQRADGSGGLEPLTNGQFEQYPTSTSSDGQLLAFAELHPVTQRDLWVLRLSDRKLQPVLRTRFNETQPRFSPDDHWLAYTSDESGHYEIYVQPYPGTGGKYQISTDGGTEPVWNSNGKELFYRSGNKTIAVNIRTQPNFSSGKPTILFEGPYVGGLSFSYDVSPDGQRFLMLKPGEQTTQLTQIVVVQNWFEELKRRVPTGK